MNSTREEEVQHQLAYFSHSYNASFKDLNHFFWKILREHDLYATVDRPARRDDPMDVTYIEWMMRRSSCFVSVVPRRPPNAQGLDYSQYQLFENQLAIRAKKPRLILLENDLDVTRFYAGGQELGTFDVNRFEADSKKFSAMVGSLVQRCGKGVVGDEHGIRAGHYLYSRSLNNNWQSAYNAIEKAFQQNALTSKLVNLDEFPFDPVYLMRLLEEDASIVIVDVDPAIFPQDILGLLHGRGMPLIRLCRTSKTQSQRKATTAMGLAGHTSSYKKWPRLFTGHQIDSTMEPVLFWSDAETLAEKVSKILFRIKSKRDDLIEPERAADYFHSLGRLRGSTFISYSGKQAPLVDEITKSLREKSVEFFDYTQRRDPGIDNWVDDIRHELFKAVVVVVLIDNNFLDSAPCRMELEIALDRFRNGEIKLFPYRVQQTHDSPLILHEINKHIENRIRGSRTQRAHTIAEDIVRFLEEGRTGSISVADQSKLVSFLDKQDDVGQLFRTAGLENHRAIANTESLNDSAKIIDNLIHEKEIVAKSDLGLIVAAGSQSTKFDSSLWEIVRRYALLPDIRLRMIRPAFGKPIELELSGDEADNRCKLFTFGNSGKRSKRPKSSGILGGDLFPFLVDNIPKEAERDTWIRKIGEGVFEKSFAQIMKSEVAKSASSNAGPTESANGQPNFVHISSDRDTFGIPIEWARIDPNGPALCLTNPVSRRRTDHSNLRDTVWNRLQTNPTPIKILLIQGNAKNLLRVRQEIEEIRDMFLSLFKKLGWPSHFIETLSGTKATFADIKQKMQHGEYEIFHYAGHTGQDEDGNPGLQVVDHINTSQSILIDCETLASWFRKSKIRFAFFNSCRSGRVRKANPYIGNLIDSAVAGQVPDVLGHIWPISDSKAKSFAVAFYESYLRSLDATAACFESRLQFAGDSSVWAAPVLVTGPAK